MRAIILHCLEIVRGHSPVLSCTTAESKALFVHVTTAASSRRHPSQAQPQNMASHPIR
jgi:hypothetical protein